MSDAILVVNAGSTSLKFAAYGVDAAGSLPLLCGGRIDSMQGDPHFVVKDAAGKPLAAHEWGDGHTIDHKAALHFVITWLEANLSDMKVVAAGHRVVLGGTRFEAPTRIEGDVLDYLDIPGGDGAVAPGFQRAWRPRARRGVPGPAAGRLLRQFVPSHDAGGGADLRAATGRTRCGRAALGLSRHLLRLHQPAGAEIRAAGAAGDRRASRRRRQHVRHAGRTQRRNHDGLRRRVRPADGDALGRRAAGRIVLSAAPQVVRRRVAGEDAVRAMRACSACPAAAATCGCCRRARIRAPSRRWSISFTR